MYLELNCKSYSFECKSRVNGSGFMHECMLYIDGVLSARSYKQYYNKAFEKYRFQNVMKLAVNQLIEVENKNKVKVKELKEVLKKL